MELMEDGRGILLVPENSIEVCGVEVFFAVLRWR